MIQNSLFNALQPGAQPLFQSLAGLRPSQPAAQGESVEDPQKDRFDLTPAPEQGGFRSFAFQFRRLAIRREVAAVRSTAKETAPAPPQEDKSVSTSSRSVQVERQTELNLFYARTQTISVDLGQETASHLQSTSQNVGRTFEVSISLDASFLHQFAGHSETFAQGDSGLFDEYLSATDRMIDISGEAAQGFFDRVDQALEDTQSAVMDGLDAFLNDVGASFGLEGDSLTSFKSQVADQVAAFFSDLDQFISRSQDLLYTAAPSQGVPSAVAAPSPQLEAPQIDLL
ncbi:MAG: hypothetical protein A3F84_21385 [Candidatus Handelsmanbacteria bacterium RIFCSPLOWO2_12_FULL_64_10]|uniref:DUF5610 domain-containing protein n=1 Tax=Handelsmanbacteria sp. (strain RIFCSPLOWO2_12_FULL_64_10) TaxID=1817868 RepID=A0A1F6C354_HANXR|nr:MAG: hypothetical protein A3F84_21385 [Candidatus Handelsmanbacteria bacterium RIFCSPLOWO2_12_FULL_64_10]